MSFCVYNDDTITVAQNLDSNSVDYSVFSPPFETLYTYSDDYRDMGNSTSSEEFWQHYKFLIAEQFRVMKPGRNISIHCMNLPTSKVRDGFIGIRDFRGEIIRAYQDAGFIYHSEVCVWKNPVVAMQRTKALGLLHKQIKKDSTMSRMGIPDHVVTMRKPGENEKPVSGEFTYYTGTDPDGKFIECKREDGSLYFTIGDGTSIDVWQRYASPVWHDIQQSRTLNGWRKARSDKDERHICPLQLDVIERCMQMWTKKDDVVWSPFMGIGSEGVVALQMGRQFIGAELKPEYFKMAEDNLNHAIDTTTEEQMALQF